MQQYERGERKVVVASRISGDLMVKVRRQASLENKSVSEYVAEVLSAALSDS